MFTQVNNDFAYKQVYLISKSEPSIFDDVLSLEVKTLSLICHGNLFQILTPEILSN